MIGLIGSMLRARRLQAVIVALIATVTIGVAVAVPAFIAAGDNAVIASEVAHAPADQLDVHASSSYKLTGSFDQPENGFANTVPKQFALPGFDVTFSTNTDVSVAGRTFAYPRLEFRQNACDHVVIVSGRCAVGTGEVMIDMDLAKREALTAGTAVALAYAVNSADNGWEVRPGTLPLTVTVAGVFRARGEGEPFWGQDGLFLNLPDRGADAPMLTTAGTIKSIQHHEEEQSVDAVLRPSALTTEGLDTIRRQVTAEVAQAESDDRNVIAGSDISDLIATIDHDRATLREVVPVLAIPLIALGCFVVFLAGGYAVSGRREELGVVALRGAPWRPRWLLGTGESLTALVIAVPLGYVLGYAAARLAARFALSGNPSAGTFGHGSGTYVFLTVVACLLAILFSAYRTLRTPTSELLRNVPPNTGRWRAATIEFVLVALAVVGVIQMRGEHARLTGIELVAPGLAIAAVAVVAARLVTPFTAWIGRRALRSRRGLGLGIGALQIARRPGAARVFVLLVVAVGLVTFGAANASVASTERADRAEQDLGAPQVVSVQPVGRLALLNAVRKVDPAGTFAMAASFVPQSSQLDPPMLAVDSSRLAAVASWPAGSPLSAGAAAAILDHPAAKPITFTGETIALDVTIKSTALPDFDPHLMADVESLTTGLGTTLDFGQVHNGRFVYNSVSSACSDGCRLADINFIVATYQPDTVSFTFHSLSVRQPVPAVVTTFASAADFHGVHGILSGGTVPVAESPDGLVVTPPAGFGSGVQFYLMPTDTPYPVPGISTTKLTHPLQGKLGDQGIPVPVRQSALVPALPRLATNGILLDLQDVDRAVPAGADLPVTSQVWLSASAPADTVARLSAAGLVVSGKATIDQERSYFGHGGPAVGGAFLWLLVAGVVLLLIGGLVLTASVDRGRRGAELRALRVQGLTPRRVRAAARFGYVGLAVVAIVVGVVAGAASWWSTGLRVPVFADGSTLVGAPTWPTMSDSGARAGLVVAAVAVVLLAVSFGAAWDLRRAVRRTVRSAQGMTAQRGAHIRQRESAGSTVGSSR